MRTKVSQSHFFNFTCIFTGSREMQRRKRMQSAIQRLKNIVPGLTENSNEMEVLNMTAKYIEFMRHFVDVEHDKQFLMSQIL